MKRKILLSILIVLIIAVISTSVFADEITSSMAGISASNGNSKIISTGQQVLGIVQAVGMAVAVIMLMVMAIRFMVASVEEKAQIKEQMKPFVIGAILLFATSAFLGVAFGLGNAINKLG